MPTMGLIRLLERGFDPPRVRFVIGGALPDSRVIGRNLTSHLNMLGDLADSNQTGLATGYEARKDR